MCSRCSPTPASARRCTRSCRRAAWRRSSIRSPAIAGSASTSDRIAEIERELASLEAQREAGLESELEELRAEQARAEARRDELAVAVEARRVELDTAERGAEEARAAHRSAEQAVEAARREAARVGAELAAVNHFLRAAGTAPAGVRSLAEEVGAEAGYELAVAAALGSLLRAGVVSDLREGHALLDAAGSEGGTALLPAAHAT